MSDPDGAQTGYRARPAWYSGVPAWDTVEQSHAGTRDDSEGAGPAVGLFRQNLLLVASGRGGHGDSWITSPPTPSPTRRGGATRSDQVREEIPVGRPASRASRGPVAGSPGE